MRYLYLLLLFAPLYCSCVSLSKVPKISSIEEYKQLDSTHNISEGIFAVLFSYHPAFELYTDIDLILKNKTNRGGRELKRSFTYQFIKHNKGHLKIYRDNEVLWFTFMDSIIDYYAMSRQSSNLNRVGRNFFAVENKNHHLTAYYSDESKDEDADKISYLRELLHNTIEEYRTSNLYIHDLTNRSEDNFGEESVADYMYPNYIVLHYNSIRGMDIMYYNDLSNVDFMNTYFRALADLLSQMCKEYNLINIFATVPVLKYKE